jgi:twitching motility two-component system response regulator PilH
MPSILVVDDVQTDRELVGMVVSKAGHQPIYAGNGAEAHALAKRHKPALILMDVVMPTQDGFKTCRDLKQDPETAAIPVVLVTSKGTKSDHFWGKKQGADGYVTKPFTPDSLIAAIRQFVR